MTSDRISSRKPSFSMGVTLRPHPIQSTAFYSAPTSDLHRVLRTTFPSESSQLAVGSRGPLDTVVVSSLLGVALCCSKPWLAVRLFSKSILHAWGHLPRMCSFSGSGVFFVSGHHQKKKSTYLIQSGIMQWELGNCDCHQLEKFLLGFLQKFFSSFHPDYPGSFCRVFFNYCKSHYKDLVQEFSREFVEWIQFSTWVPSCMFPEALPGKCSQKLVSNLFRNFYHFSLYVILISTEITSDHLKGNFFHSIPNTGKNLVDKFVEKSWEYVRGKCF